MNSTICTPFLSQKADATSFLAGVCLFKLFQLVWRMWLQPLFDCSLVSTFTKETQVSLIYYVYRPQCNVYQLVKLASKHFVVDVHDVTNQLKYIMLLKVLILKY
jgi:hypothetical protein